MYEDSIYDIALCISCAHYLAPGDDHSPEYQILMWSHQLLVWTSEWMHMFLLVLVTSSYIYSTTNHVWQILVIWSCTSFTCSCLFFLPL